MAGGNGMKLLLQALVVAFHGASWSEGTSFNMYINSGPWAVSIYFLISGFLVGCNPPLNKSNKLIHWLSWIIRRILPTIIIVYLIWPIAHLFARRPPSSLNRPDTLDPIFWTWKYYYWTIQPPPAVYEINQPLWFISVLTLFQILTPFIIIIIDLIIYHHIIHQYLLIFIFLLIDFFVWKRVPPFGYDGTIFSITKYCPWTYFTIYLLGTAVGSLRRHGHDNTSQTHKSKFLIDASSTGGTGSTGSTGGVDSLSISRFVKVISSYVLMDMVGIIGLIITIYSFDPPGGYIINKGMSPLADASHFSLVPWSIFLYLSTTGKKSILIKILNSRYLNRLAGASRTVRYNQTLAINAGQNYTGNAGVMSVHTGAAGIPFIYYLIHYPFFYWLSELKMFSGTILIHCTFPVYIISVIINCYVYSPINKIVNVLSQNITKTECKQTILLKSLIQKIIQPSFKSISSIKSI